MIHVIANIETVPGRREEFIAEFKKNIPNVLAEEGCIEYMAAIDLENQIPAQLDARDNVMTVIEKWEDIESLETHLIAPHMIAFRAQVKELVVEVTLRVLQPA